MPTSKSVQFTVKRSCFGYPIICVRVSIPDITPGEWTWGRWRRATQREQDIALMKLQELNQ